MNSFDFKTCYTLSETQNASTLTQTIQKMIHGCVAVDKSPKDHDRNGVDFWARLAGGSMVGIDHKTRAKGCGRFWKNGEPELSLETWSVMPGSCATDSNYQAVGWTLDDKKITDYTVHTFHEEDTRMVYLMPFQLLRMAFLANQIAWASKYRVAEQSNYKNGFRAYVSQCIFVPAEVVVQAVSEQMAYRP